MVVNTGTDLDVAATALFPALESAPVAARQDAFARQGARDLLGRGAAIGLQHGSKAWVTRME
jgi:hypothetical protein